ncbi:MAG: CHAT domain-containing protein [Chloroflexi bacterium]|nr:CHAT domain-containing protein [Chloroflexota bacterium]
MITMTDKQILADKKIDNVRTKVREWGEKLARYGQWDWHPLGHALQYVCEAIEAAPNYQRSWTLLADICHRIGKLELARKCLTKSYNLASSGPNFPGGFYKKVKGYIQSGYPFNDTGGLQRQSPPEWFEEKYQPYYDNINIYLSKPVMPAIDGISILFLAAEPDGTVRLRLGEELREIQEKLQLAKLRNRFKLEQRFAVRPQDLSQALLDVQPHIVHFSGHGTRSGELCFESQTGEIHPIQPAALAALFEQFANCVNCVILNSCYSEIQANAIAEHVRFVIGMHQAIGDKAAIAFSVGFYQALGAGRSAKEAYELGRVQVMLQNIPENLTPVLVEGKA